MSDTKFDLVVIGGGPGGYVASIRASQLNMKVALVESEHLGGVCLNWGCIPTKTLLRSAEVYHMLGSLEEFGLRGEEFSFDIKKVVARSRKVAKQLNNGIRHLLKKNKISVFEGRGKLGGANTVVVEGKDTTSLELTADNIILATGARARIIPNLKPDGKRIWTYREAMVPETLPSSLLVIGSGAIGVEFASFYADMGAEVTIVETLDRILPNEDQEISTFARNAFEKRQIEIHTGSVVRMLTSDKDNVVAEIILSSGKEVKKTYERVILAVGIVGNSEDIGLENTAIKLDGTHVVTDECGATGVPGIYAIGDLTGAPWLAHKASHEAVTCVEHIAGLRPHPMKKEMIPGCTYSRPQIASVGLTEEKALELGYEVRVGRFPLVGNGKAIALGETEGLVKTIFDSNSGELLGAHMIGPEVTEQIQGYVIAKMGEMTEEELMHTIFPHPTLSESMHESVLDAYGKAIHI
ncbi:MAG: dihydrolipoyl dehydrogenase [Pseudomonadota bacterium]|nr:dihydrolipoyl dehydrogenase [Pseudomonadota bacterium]